LRQPDSILLPTTRKADGLLRTQAGPPGRPEAEAEGFVLAGGRSTRMGRDKAALEVAGRSLLEHMRGKLRSLGIRARVAGASPDVERVAGSVAQSRQDEYLADTQPGCGPLSGIESALRATDAAWNLCVAVDLPLLPAAWLRYLLERAEITRARATIPYVGGRPQPLCAIYHRDLLPWVSAALRRGDYKVMRVLEAAALELGGEREIDRFHSEAVWAARLWEDPRVSATDAFLNCNAPRDVELVAFRLARAANGGWSDAAAHRSMR
jgi:molybdenum cofactor guanylyltransferase